MPKLTYFPLLMDRWVAGTRGLTFEEKGFYLDLLIWMYDNGRGIKDADHAARVLGCDPRTSRRLLAKLRPKFYERSGELFHKLVREILKNGGKVRELGRYVDLTELPTDPDPDPEKEKDSPTESPKRKSGQKKFIKPTLAEVTAYCEERGKGVNPKAWMNHYQANGWKCGRNPMKDWKAAVRTWEHGKPSRGNGKSAQSWQQTVDAMGAQLGLSPRPGESYEQYGSRVNAAKARAH